jgi:hypothetical protein
MQVNKHVFQYLPTICAQNYTHTHTDIYRERVLQDQIFYRLRESWSRWFNQKWQTMNALTSSRPWIGFLQNDAKVHTLYTAKFNITDKGLFKIFLS